MSERIIYEVTVPESERDWAEDIPEVYRVVEFDDPERPKCIVHGRYSAYRPQPEWIASPPCRWLVRHLIGRLNELVELKEWRDSYECDETPERRPQRFRYRTHGSTVWEFGAVFSAGQRLWTIRADKGFASFRLDPWEVMGLVIGDVAEFRWIDNDFGWSGDHE